jgi:uncharacterized protein
VEAAKSFYAAALGWTTDALNEGYTLLKSGEAVVGGLQPLPEGLLPGPLWLTYLATDDVDGAAHRARQRGAGTIATPRDIPGFGRVAVLTDPGGAPFGLRASA